MSSLPRCTRHPGAPAGWRCRACGAGLCPACAATARFGTEGVPACAGCGGFADAVTVARSVLTPYPARLWRAATYPFSRGTALAMLAVGAVLAVLRWLPMVGGALAFGLSWAFFFGVVRQSSAGATDFQAPEDAELLDAIVLPALRGLLALAILWVPAIVRIAGLVLAGEVDSPAAVLADPLLWLILVAGVLYAPAALLHAAFGSTLGMLNPVRVIGTAARLGGDYLLAVGAVALVVGADLLTDVLFPGAFGSIPVVSSVARATVGLVAPTFAAHALGLLLHVRGDDVGLGRPEDYLVPVLGAAVPQGTLPEPRTEASAAAEAYRRPTEIDLEPPPAALPATPEALEIARLAGVGDLAAAARLFGETRPAPALAPAVAFAVGRAAWQAGSVEAAAAALHQAGVAGDPAVSPGALLVLGRIYQGRLGRPAEAREVLEYLLQAYPASDAAPHARAALAGPAATGPG